MLIALPLRAALSDNRFEISTTTSSTTTSTIGRRIADASTLVVTGHVLGVTVCVVSDRASGVSVLTSVYQQNVCAETEARCLRTWRSQEEYGGKNPRKRGKKHFLEHLFTSSEKLR
jgi:hypothetical protein